MLIKKMLSMALAVAAVGLAASVAIGAVHPRAASSAPTPGSYDAQPPDALSAFGVLGDGSLKPDGGEAILVTRSLRPPGHVLDPEKTRLVSARDPQIYVVAGSDTICVRIIEISGTGSAGCTDPALANGDKGLMTDMTRVADGWRVTILAPDAIDHVALVLEDGQERVLPIERSIATAVVADSNLTLAWTDRSGNAHRQDVTIPDPH